MVQIPTAEAFLIDRNISNPKGHVFRLNLSRDCHVNTEKDIQSALIEFAKMHVTAALKEASENATWKDESFDTYFGDSRNFDFIDTDGAGDPSTGHIISVDKDSILNSYPLTNIK
jgi:hypothetical protein